MLNKTINEKYKITASIGEGGMSKVYLAKNIYDKKKVAVKILKTNTISNRVEDLIRFRNESTIMSSLKHPNIVKIFEIGEYQNLHYIIMENLKGDSLAKKISKNNFFKINESLKIIKQVSKALDYIHDSGIIHRDLKPGNIIINENVKLIDFNLAQIKEFTQIKKRNEIVGTFSYMSPEQSGVIKRNIDQRSDLYSLGIIFYQLLSGELPYTGKSISSIIHQHISNTPKPLSNANKEIPPILQKIVEKLIEKEPAKRYQNAKGLLSDLSKFQKGEKSFKLDLVNRYTKLNYKTKPVGMDDEIKKIKNLYEYTLEKKGVACLISGEAGCGKTRLTEELQKFVSLKSGNFLIGKCFSAENLVPYAPFKDALNIYINKFNHYSDARKKMIREELKNNLGELIVVLLKLNPMLENIIGKSHRIVELEAERENKRFLMIVTKFFQILGSVEKGLVLKLQDLQWADEGSIEIIESIIEKINDIPIFIVCTYRNNEIKSRGRLNNLLKSTEENFQNSAIQKKFKKIHLSHFSKIEMNTFVSEILHDKHNSINHISQFIFKKSKGNPFFAIQLLKQLIQESVIFYKKNSWHINKKLLKKIQISGLIVDIVLKRIKSLNRVQKVILSYSAVIGKKLDISLLFNLLNQSKKSRIHFSKEKIIKAVDDAVSIQLLEEDNQSKGHSLFIHDKIKEAFYKNIKPEKRIQLHLEIARTLEKINKNKLKKNIQNCDVLFDLAHHYTEGKNSEKSLKYSYQAGIKSKNNHANEDAIKYFTIARNILVKQGKKSVKMRIKCQEYLGEIYLITGENTKAIKMFNDTLNFMKTNIQKANIYKQISSAYLKKGELKNCEYYGKLALRTLGENFPKTKITVIFSMIKQSFIHILHSNFPTIFIKKKTNTEQSQKNNLIIQTYLSLSWSYVLTDTWNFVRTVLRMLNISESRIGKSKELATSMRFYAGACMAIPLFKRSLRYHTKALDMNNELKDEWGTAQSLQFFGFLYEWKGDYYRSIEYFKKSIDIFKKIGDIKETAMAQNGLLSNYYNLAEYKTALDIGNEYLAYCRNIQDKFGIVDSFNNFSKCYIALGDYNKAENYAKQALKLSNEKSMSLNYCISNIYLGIVNMKKNNLDIAIKYLNKAKDIFEKNNLIQQYSVFLYFHLAQAYTYKYNESSNSKLLLKKIKKTCQLAIKKSKSWPTHYPSALRTKANYLSLIDKSKKSEKLFLQSIKLCQKRYLKFELAKSLFDYGHFLKLRGRDIDSKFKLESAYRIFRETNSKIFLQRTAEILGINNDTITTTQRLNDKQKLTSLIKVSQNISSILNLNILLKQIISKAIEVTGAQRGYVFILNNKTKKLEIKASTSSLKKKTKHYSNSIVNRVFKSHQPIITTNAEIEEPYDKFKSVAEYGLKSILCIPIKHHDKLIGIFYLDNALSSGVFSDEDVEILNVFMTQAAIAIENAKAYLEIDNLNKNLEQKVIDRTKKLNEAYGLIKKDLQLAKNIQQTALTRDFEKIENFNINLRYIPMSEVGGDIYDIHEIKPGYIRIFLADATGHGIQAALVTMLIKVEYGLLKKSEKKVNIILEKLNNSFIKHYRNMNIFFSSILIDIDKENKKISYSSAGHPVQYLSSKDEITDLSPTGRIIGILENIKYRIVNSNYSTNDRLYLFTDGLFEEFNKKEEMFGETRTKSIIKTCKNKSSKQTIDKILNELYSFIDETEQQDDITIIGIDI